MSMLDAYAAQIRDLERENKHLQGIKSRLESELLDMTERTSHARSEIMRLNAALAEAKEVITDLLEVGFNVPDTPTRRRARNFINRD